MFTDLEKLRKLRNRFAHQKLPVDFNDKEVKDLIDGLSTALEYGQHMKGKRYNLSDKGDKALAEFRAIEAGFIKYYKGCFSLCVLEALSYLETATLIIKKAGLSMAREHARECWSGYSVNSRHERCKQTFG